MGSSGEVYSTKYSLAPCKSAPVPKAIEPWPNKKKEETMQALYVDQISSNADAIEAKRLRHLNNRIEAVYAEKRDELRKTFFIDDDQRPKNFNELLERLTSGKFKIEDKYKDRSAYLGLDYVSWRTQDADETGYEAAKEELKKARQIAIDDATVLPAADGLKALREFEAWTLKGKDS